MRRDEREEVVMEWLRCKMSAAHFLDHYGWVYDATARQWLRFELWPAQREALRIMRRQRLVVALKARQLGMSWLVIGYGLWHMILHPKATVLFFSRRDDEAVQLLDARMKEMYRRLPEWMHCTSVLKSTAHEWRLSNGSSALAFPTTGGRSYTATLAIVDEADFAPDLDDLLNAVKPTIDAGGRLILLSTVDKSRPESAFKRIYWAAKQVPILQSPTPDLWTPLFLSWRARPGRDEAWYEQQRADVLARTGALDDLHQEYPATDLDALAPRSTDARFAAAWLNEVADIRSGLDGQSGRCRGAGHEGWDLPGLEIYEEPEVGKTYVIGADPAEGNPQSDESAATVLEADTGREAASLAGRFDPAIFATYLTKLSELYNGAAAMVERNNHGHAVILALQEGARGAGYGAGSGAWPNVQLLEGLDGKPGWLTTTRSKVLAYDHAAERFRQGEARVRSAETLRQLQGICGTSLAAPEGQKDDRAMSFVLALAALKWGQTAFTGESAIIPPYDPLEDLNRKVW